MKRPACALRVAAFALATSFVAASWTAPQAADDLFYEDDGGRIVFTNVPSVDARPVPGLGGDPPAPAPRARRASTPQLPVTIYDPFIERVAREHGLSPALIKAVALVESGFNPHAVSPRGAQGLMQLMPGTARAYGVRDPLDPMQNLQAGAAHLKGLLDEFDGDLTLALAAYNAGSGAVRKHGGVPNYKETREYVRRVHDRLGREAPLGEGSTGSPAAAVKYRDVQLVMAADGSVLLAN